MARFYSIPIDYLFEAFMLIPLVLFIFNFIIKMNSTRFSNLIYMFEHILYLGSLLSLAYFHFFTDSLVNFGAFRILDMSLFNISFELNSLNIYLSLILYLVMATGRGLVDKFRVRKNYNKIFFVVIFIGNLALFSSDIFSFFVFEEILTFLFLILIIGESRPHKNLKNFHSLISLFYVTSIAFILVLAFLCSKAIVINGLINFTPANIISLKLSNNGIFSEKFVSFFVMLIAFMVRSSFFSLFFKDQFMAKKKQSFWFRFYPLVNITICFYSVAFFIIRSFPFVFKEYRTFLITLITFIFSLSLLAAVRASEKIRANYLFQLAFISLVYLGVFINTAYSINGALLAFAIYPVVFMGIQYINYLFLENSGRLSFIKNEFIVGIVFFFYFLLLIPIFPIVSELFYFNSLLGFVFLAGLACFPVYFFSLVKSFSLIKKMYKNLMFEDTATLFGILLFFIFVGANNSMIFDKINLMIKEISFY